jgi:CDP-diacylglycerol---glycerol-3-phosphate 3-phosphatidyltransferase
MNWANLVTYLRILLIPAVIACFHSTIPSANLWATVLFSIASLSDWLDGYLARKLNQSSEFGAFLDPVADKLLVAVVLIMLVASYPVLWFAAAVIITRELLISALREWMAGKGKRDTVAVAFSGKLKTTIQMFAIIGLLLANDEYPHWIWQIGFYGIHFAALISVYSMLQYFKNAWSTLQED